MRDVIQGSILDNATDGKILTGGHSFGCLTKKIYQPESDIVISTKLHRYAY